MLYIPFRSGRNGRKISYRYEAPPCFTSSKISACFGLFRPFRPVLAKLHVPGRNTFLAFFFFFSASFASASASSSAVSVSASASSYALLLLLLLLCFFCFLCFFFRPALSLFLYLWWTARRTAVTLQLAMKNHNSFQSTFICMVN